MRSQSIMCSPVGAFLEQYSTQWHPAKNRSAESCHRVACPSVRPFSVVSAGSAKKALTGAKCDGCAHWSDGKDALLTVLAEVLLQIPSFVGRRHCCNPCGSD